jgi:hypothetical protein
MVACCAVAVNFRSGNHKSIFAKLTPFERRTLEAVGLACSAHSIVEEEPIFANAALLSVSDSTLNAVSFSGADLTITVDNCPVCRTDNAGLIAVTCDVGVAETHLRKHVPSEALKTDIRVVAIANETANTARRLTRAVSQKITTGAR